MPLAAAGLRLSSLRCNSTAPHFPSAYTLASAQRRKPQRRIFVSCSRPHDRRAPFLRSPIQWSHIVQHIRRPEGVTALSAMGAKSRANGVQKRTHAGHSHGHHHHHDNTYLTSSNKKDPGVRITRIGLYVNLGMAIGKGLGGYVFNSQAYVVVNI